MDFMEAVKQMKKGKKVRSQAWGKCCPTSCVLNDEPGDNRGLRNNKGYFFAMTSESFEATDWEIVEEDTEWNLAEQTYPEFNITFNKKENESSLREMNSLIANDVKKCRDLIIQDIKKNVYKEPTFEWYKNMINNRFGDL